MSSGEWIADYPSVGQFRDRLLACSNYRPQSEYKWRRVL